MRLFTALVLPRCCLRIRCCWGVGRGVSRAGDFIYLDERHAWELKRRRLVRIASYEEAAAVERGDQVIGARSGVPPRLALDMPL